MGNMLRLSVFKMFFELNIGSKTWSSNSNEWLKSENKATRSKKATEIGSLALCLRQKALLCTET